MINLVRYRFFYHTRMNQKVFLFVMASVVLNRMLGACHLAGITRASSHPRPIFVTQLKIAGVPVDLIYAYPISKLVEVKIRTIGNNPCICHQRNKCPIGGLVCRNNKFGGTHQYLLQLFWNVRIPSNSAAGQGDRERTAPTSWAP